MGFVYYATKVSLPSPVWLVGGKVKASLYYSHSNKFTSYIYTLMLWGRVESVKRVL